MTPEASSSTLVLNDESGLPPGYSIHVASGGVKYAVPKFVLAAAHTSFEAEAKKREFKINENMAMVNLISFFFVVYSITAFCLAIQISWTTDYIYSLRFCYGPCRSSMCFQIDLILVF